MDAKSTRSADKTKVTAENVERVDDGCSRQMANLVCLGMRCSRYFDPLPEQRKVRRMLKLTTGNTQEMLCLHLL